MYYYLYCCQRQEAAETVARMKAELATGQHARRLAQEEDGGEGWWRTVFAEGDAAAVAMAHELLGSGDKVEVISHGVLLCIIA